VTDILVRRANQAFVKAYFNGTNPVGTSFDMLFYEGRSAHFEVVGVVGDACYRDVHEPTLPQAYYPITALERGSASQVKAMDRATFIVRTSAANPLAMASTLRREIPRLWPEFRVSNVRTQLEIDQSHTVRERLLARLAFFFGIVALVLAGVGLYGVLDYSVLRRRREVAIRMALGAQAGHVARRVTADVFAMVIAGALVGLALGFASVRYIESLLYQVKPTDPQMLALPSLIILVAALVAALPPVIRAVRIDPAMMLRTE